MSHNTMSCAHSNCRQGHKGTDHTKNIFKKKRKRKIISNGQALGGIYFEDGKHVTLMSLLADAIQ